MAWRGGFHNRRGNSGICRPFLAGRCSYGARCKYSHEDQVSNAHPTSRSRTFGQPPPPNDKLREWKRILQRESTVLRPNPQHVSRFFQLGAELLSGDVGAMQDVVKHFATDPGLSFVRFMAERMVPTACGFTSKLDVWKTQVQPLFQLITHPNVVDSATLELEVATIYNFLSGVGGRRVAMVFDFVIDLIDSWSAPSSGLLQSNSIHRETTRMNVVELSLGVLSKMIDCNTTIIVGNVFQPFVARFAALVSEDVSQAEEFSKLQSAKYLDYIQRRLGVGEALPMLGAVAVLPVAHASFKLRRDLPGHLSADGPRHDNDHADITKISIMPTFEEIMSPRGEYLPTNDPSQWHLQGLRGRLDREFRLLREDTVGQLRDAIQGLLEDLQTNPLRVARGQGKNKLRTLTYQRPEVVKATYDRLTGLELLVSFPQPAPPSELAVRRQWWMHSKRLQSGGLVCAVDAAGSVIFLVVSDASLRTGNEERAEGSRQKRWGQNEQAETQASEDRPSLADDGRSSYVRLNLVEPQGPDIERALDWFRPLESSRTRFFLVEFPGVLLPSFQHTLSALQEMTARPQIPFADLISPAETAGGDVQVPRPHYSLQPGFEFNMRCLSTDGTTLSHSRNRPLNPKELSNCSPLDPTQSTALIDTLSRSMALIQGPPGTGKSYTGEKIIRVLLENKAKGELGPIICVCYTNHALDQLLEHLLDQGIENIIRIGSRSKSGRVQGHSLSIVAKSADRTKTEKHTIWMEGTELDELTRKLAKQLDNLQHFRSWTRIKSFLAEKYSRHHRELFGDEDPEDGFTEVHHRPLQKIESWLRAGKKSGGSGRGLEELRRVSLNSMALEERQSLHKSWLSDIRSSIIAKILDRHNAFQRTKESYGRVRQDVDLRCLNQSDVIGVTTTGLARNLTLLRKLRSKVMVCEEAGEVLEAHILTALLPSLEQLVLIGDHLQLRPPVQNYELRSDNPRGVQYSFDMSLFERLVNPPHPTDLRLPLSVLETQRRMHPSISKLIQSTLYESLKDGENVLAYPTISGMKQRLFWLDHKHPEAGAAALEPLSTSHTNDFEIEMTTALVSHLVRQGTYGNGDIAVITPYLGQMQRLKARMQSIFEIAVNDRDLAELEAAENTDKDDGEAKPPATPPKVSKTTLLNSVRIATVDNFQGEEAKVIVISLVRSNEQRRCGFLNTSNRINVLLSRAQHGMFIIGNAETCQHVPMWADVLTNLGDNGYIGSAFELQCPRHPDTPIAVSRPDHFLQFSPDGGCSLRCMDRLSCGHSCTGRCHSNLLHQAVKCLEKCPRPKPGCSHPCPRPCGEPCEQRCSTRLTGTNLRLPCGHQLSSPFCWQAQEPDKVVCRSEVERTVPGCGHIAKVKCYEDITSSSYICKTPCGSVRPCGHVCQRECRRCNTREDGEITKQDHGTCSQICQRPYTTCKHSCRQKCHDGTACKLCSAPCEAKCRHSKCSKLCHEPCTPCAEQTCASKCPHSACTMPCAAPCDWVPCSRRCNKLLACRHRCPSICGEPCPAAQFCQLCCSDDTKSTIVEWIEMSQYHEIDLDADPCVFPDCGHIVAVSSMDSQMDMGNHYDMDTAGRPAAVRSSSAPFDMDEVKVCPQCRGSLRSISRYGRIVRRALLDEATKKFISWSSSIFAGLAEKLLDEQTKLEKAPPKAVPAQFGNAALLELPASRLQQIIKISKWVGNDRYSAIGKLWGTISSQARQVKKDEQPFQRVAEYVEFARRQNRTTGEFTFDNRVIQMRGYLLASALLLQCDIVILSDFADLCRGMAQTRCEISIDTARQRADCESLIALADKTGHTQQVVEGHLYYAQFSMLTRIISTTSNRPAELSSSSEPPSSSHDTLKQAGLSHIEQARAVIRRHESLERFATEIDEVERALLDGLFYRPVTAEEMRDVYRAMSTEFLGTGHWYTCQNGHYFTVGECGMPMEQTRCPECGAPVGGHNHRAAEGVNHAHDMEQLGEGVARLLRV